jgi:signal transduction histidine kinase
MRERAEELGGSLTVRDGVAGGTAVTAVLPIAAAPATPAPEVAG